MVYILEFGNGDCVLSGVCCDSWYSMMPTGDNGVTTLVRLLLMRLC